ncbi:hypothetical protein RJT34_02725 [Clitoria ternatea]|uniref:Uncharacterized protein n=1 Tax=Clitoria ternatea TaxID=43366 RepID=A0AAN9KKU6_CLITE
MATVYTNINKIWLAATVQHQAVKPEQSESNEQDNGSVVESVSVDTKVTIDSNHSIRRGMVLPFEPHSITFDDATYSIDMPQEMRNQGVLEDKLQLLKDVNGAFRPSVLTALMGSTGVGKTTLMDGKIISK